MITAQKFAELKQKVAEINFSKSLAEGQQQAHLNEASNVIKSLMINGFLIGSVPAAFLGASRYLAPTTAPASANPYAPIVLDVPYPDEVKKKKQRKFATAGSLFSDPLFMTAAGVTGLGSAYAGWKLTSALTRAMRSRKLRQETEEAKKQYEQALLEQYDPPPAPKVASANLSLGQELSSLFQMVKRAEGETNLNIPEILAGGAQEAQSGITGNLKKYLGIGAGGMLAAMLLSGGLGTHWGYNYARQQGGKRVFEDAMQRRARNMWVSSPPEIYARPVPYPTEAEPVEDITQAGMEDEEES